MWPVNPKLSVIIVSYNTREMTLACLQELHRSLGAVDADIWVIDNGSRDGSVDAVRDAYPEINVLDLGKNLGFGAANNLAMEQAKGEYFLLLNSDAFPIGDAVQELTAFLDAHPQVGVVGPRLLNKDGSLQLSCFRFPSPAQAWLENLWISAVLPKQSRIGDYRRWNHDSERDVDFVIGACLLVRRDVFEAIGGFDPDFFLYAEESDWQRRIHDAGWKIMFTPAAQVTHLGGASGASTAGKTRDYFFSGLDKYVRKHHGLGGVVSMRLAMIIGCAMRSILWLFVMLVRPANRSGALAKLRLHSWLLVRQMTRPAPALQTSRSSRGSL